MHYYVTFLITLTFSGNVLVIPLPLTWLCSLHEAIHILVEALFWIFQRNKKETKKVFWPKLTLEICFKVIRQEEISIFLACKI